MIKPKEVLLSGEVMRWHTHDDPRLRRCGETDAAHQWGVAILVQWLDPECSKATLLWALTHDVGERGLGFDMSGPARRAHPALSQIVEMTEAGERERCLGYDVPDGADTELVNACDKLHGLIRAIIETRECDEAWFGQVMDLFDPYMRPVVQGLIHAL
jgi:5'-deoxynucleotidase YfbR-like HD superfamily hydrolase